MPRITTDKPAPKKKAAKKAPAKPKAENTEEKEISQKDSPTEGKDLKTGRFSKGNNWWEARSTHGMSPMFKSPEQMWDACCQYFDWVEKNPLWEAKVTQFQGVPVDMVLPKMRAMTVEGLSRYIGMTSRAWRAYKEKPDFVPICERAEEIIRDQKFSGAAADLLNANIIARDLGLRDKTDVDHGVQEDNPIMALIKQISGNTLDPNEGG